MRNGNCGHTYTQQHGASTEHGRSQKGAQPQSLPLGQVIREVGGIEGPGLIISGKALGRGGRPGCAYLVDKEDETRSQQAGASRGRPQQRGRRAHLSQNGLCSAAPCPVRAQTPSWPLDLHSWPPTTTWTPYPPSLPTSQAPAMPAPDIHPHSPPQPDYSSISPNKVTFTALEAVPLGAITPPAAAGSQ